MKVQKWEEHGLARAEDSAMVVALHGCLNSGNQQMIGRGCCDCFEPF
jgi:poly(3-hydroxybutyrate) depolymerase